MRATSWPRFWRNGGKAMDIAADVSDARAVAEMVAAVERELGPVDVLVNNAGLAIIREIDDLTEEEFDRTIAVNPEVGLPLHEGRPASACASANGAASSTSLPVRRAAQEASGRTTMPPRLVWKA